MGNERFLYLLNSRRAVSAASPANPEGEGGPEQDLLVARETNTERFRRGDTVALQIDPAKLHLFDADTEQVIR